MLIWLRTQPWIIINENDENAQIKCLFDKHINMGSMKFCFDYNKQLWFITSISSKTIYVFKMHCTKRLQFIH